MSSRATRRMRWVAWSAAAVLLLGLSLFWLLQTLRARDAAREAFPQQDGVVALPSLEHPVTVYRNARGVPHAEAGGESDALFALGYVHAQDRLTQMLWLRQRAQGRAAEVLGREAVEADQMARLIGFSRLAERQLPRLTRRTRSALDAYAAGVNARIDRIASGQVDAPTALRKLGIDAASWTPQDSLAVFKLFAWGLGESVEASLVLDEMIRQIGSERAAGFFPGGGVAEGLPGPARTARTAPEHSDVLDAAALPRALRRGLGIGTLGVGSSAWVLGGTHTESGLPLLAVDHHLPVSVPAWFHLGHIRGGAIDVAGATLPGVPVFWSGQNGRVAWGAVAAGAVVTDLYREALHRDGSDRYYDGRRWSELSVRTETIAVRGEDPIEMRVRRTGHGPLLPTEGQEALSISWTGARIDAGSGIGSLLDLARAQDARELVHALKAHHEPVLAVVFVDGDGAAGMQVAGWIPQRELSHQLVPLDGRAPSYAWDTRVPFDLLPSARLLDGEGWVVAADASLAPRGRASIDWLWHPGARAARIEALLGEAVRRGPVDLRDFAALQTDVAGVRERKVIEAIEALAGVGGEPLGPRAEELAGFLFAWDGVATADSQGAAAYHAMLAPLYDALLAHAIGPGLWRRYLALPRTDGQALLLDLLEGAAADAAAGGPRARRGARVVRESLRKAWLQLYDLGPNRSRWTWGRLHPIRFQGFGGLGERIRHWELPARPYPGTAHTILAADYDPLDPFAVGVASTARLVFDAGALRESLVGIAPGQSEHPEHRNFDDGLESWLQGRPSLLATGPLLVEETSVARLRLEPVD